MNLNKVLNLNLILHIFLFSNLVSASECKDQTQYGLNQCANAELARETNTINKSYNTLMSKLNPSQKRQLKQAQLAWIKYKDLACKFESSGVEGGSVRPMVLSNCVSKKTAQRNAELEALGKCEEGDISCPAW